MFQLEGIVNQIQYEKDYLDLKVKKLSSKVDIQLKEQVEKKKKLRSMLDDMYEGQLKYEQKELMGVASKMNKDSTDKEIKLQDASKDLEQQINQIKKVKESGVNIELLLSLST